MASKAKPDYIDLDKDGNKKEPMKKAAQDKKKKTNESYKAAAVGRKLQQMAEVEPNDMIANAMANLATHLENFGTSFSAKTIDDLVQKTGMDKNIIKALINRAVKKESMSESKLVEGLADMADMAERDHEVQMARADLYKIAKYAIKLHDMMKQVTEAEGIQGWQQAKISKASDYISSVYHSLDYDMQFPPNEEGGAIATAEGKYKSAAQRKAVHANKAKNESADPYKQSLRSKLAEKAVSKDQQRAAGIALKHKREGTKPPKGSASASMMSMSTKELEKLASTEHKGLPKDKS